MLDLVQIYCLYLYPHYNFHCQKQKNRFKNTTQLLQSLVYTYIWQATSATSMASARHYCLNDETLHAKPTKTKFTECFDVIGDSPSLAERCEDLIVMCPFRRIYRSARDFGVFLSVYGIFERWWINWGINWDRGRYVLWKFVHNKHIGFANFLNNENSVCWINLIIKCP